MSESKADPSGDPVSRPFGVQVVIDCADPHRLADWWAETLRWQVEPTDEGFIRSMIEQGFATDGDTIFHRGELRWRTAHAVRSPDEASAGHPRLLFQLVPEAKTSKNRIHIDLRPDRDVDIDEIRANLVERGATVVGGGREGPHEWVTMADPEGNEFCI